jgi:hypothetical protein
MKAGTTSQNCLILAKQGVKTKKYMWRKKTIENNYDNTVNY